MHKPVRGSRPGISRPDLSGWMLARGGHRKRQDWVECTAAWSVRHRRAVVVAWVILTGLVFLAGRELGTGSAAGNDAGQSGAGEQMIQRQGITLPVGEEVLIQAPGTDAPYPADPRLQQAARQVASTLARLTGAATDIRSPLDADGGGLVSADGRSVLVSFDVPGPPADSAAAVYPALRAVAAVQARYPGLFIGETGSASYQRALNTVLDSGFRRAEATSVPITLVVLIVVFGALVAASMPVLLAVISVIVALSLLTLASRWLPTGSVTSEVVLIIGMAVGVDYSLFYLRRAREEQANGSTPAIALRTAAATSGRAVAVSGLTVMIALAGLFVVDYDVFTGIAFGSIAVVGVAVLGSVTLLPAMLAGLGRRTDRGRVPLLGRRRVATKPSGMWAGLVRHVVRHPLLAGIGTASVLLTLAVPAFGMRFASPATDLPPANSVQQAADRIAAAFPLAPSPALLVVIGHDLGTPAVREAFGVLTARVRAVIGTPSSGVKIVSATGDAEVVAVQLPGNGTDAASTQALLKLRDTIVPQSLGQVDDLSYAVTGNTAANYDDATALHAGTVAVVVFVVLMSFFVLLIAFGSAYLALISIALNLLSVGAGYGLVTLIFQDGRLQSLLGYTSFGGIVPWIPLFIFVLLFGLSIDYHVFVLSRIRELRIRGASSRDAVLEGVSASAGVVSSAAVIMVAVFSVLATLPVVEAKILGVGLAAAVLIDATVVRGILLPAAVTLLGERWRVSGTTSGL